MPSSAPITLLTIVAHPDDEVLIGGTLAKYAAEGSRVVLAWVTRGELGEISDPALGTPETLGEVREGEARAAATALGLTEIRFLDFRDSGMAGTEGNADPRTLPQTDPAEATRRFVTLVREVRPDVIITHDPAGGYGHPDHIGANQATLAALAAAGDASQFPDAGPAWQPSRLLYMVQPRSFFERTRDMARQLQPDATPFEDFDIDRYAIKDEDITIVVDVTPYLDAKNAGFKVHRTQFSEDNFFARFPQDFMRDLMSREYFAQAWPEPTPGQPQATRLEG